ncbi:hypothetical protein ACFQ0O_28100 [Saccharopolyspora spinosporotrichia]
MVWRTSNAEVRERKAAGLPGRHVRAGLLWLEADDNVANQAGGDVRWEHAAPESVEERAARAETKLKAARIRRGWTYDDAARALADAINDAGGEPVTPNYLSKRLMRWDFGTPVPAEYRPFLREIFGLTDVEIGSSGLASAGAFEVQAHEPADAALIEDDVVMGGWSEPESGTGLGADGDVAVQWDPQPGEDVERPRRLSTVRWRSIRSRTSRQWSVMLGGRCRDRTRPVLRSGPGWLLSGRSCWVNCGGPLLPWTVGWQMGCGKTSSRGWNRGSLI